MKVLKTILFITIYVVCYDQCNFSFLYFFKGLRLCPFLEDHKEDILCGPVWLAIGLDLSGHAGMLTLTSPKLVKGNTFARIFWGTKSKM